MNSNPKRQRGANTPAGFLRAALHWVLGALAVCFVPGISTARADEPVLPARAKLALEKHCGDCHGNDLAEARINFAQLTSGDIGRDFKDWQRVIQMLRERKMPPAGEPQLADAERQAVIADIQRAVDKYITLHAGDPGPVVLRRLTSAEFAYTVEDLTGLSLDLARGFVSDGVGGEGFTNVGGAQFMQDATLERYLEAAKTVADHAVIGAGPLGFFRDPGKTGRELSAIARINSLYRRHGFRTAAGEGAEPFGTDLYPRAFFVAWRFRYRAELRLGELSVGDLARQEGVSVRLCEHVQRVLETPDPPFPLSEIISHWRALPVPRPGSPRADQARAACDELGRLLRDWQSTLAAGAGDEEEAAVLTAGQIQVKTAHAFETDIEWPDDSREARFEFSVATASERPAGGALVVWRNPRMRFLREDRRRDEPVPLSSLLGEEAAGKLGFGKHPAGGSVGATDLVLRGETIVPLTVPIPPGKIAALLFVEVELDLARGADRIVRCRISDGKLADETAAEVGDASTLLANPASSEVARWKIGVGQFAGLLPEVSQREPAPSDRDPIPPPFDNTYNMPERNHFHYAVKYHRDDEFLVEHVLDDATRRELDQAWTDLLMSFEYHDANLRFVAKKFGVDVAQTSIADLDLATIARLPAEPRGYIERLKTEYQAMQAALVAAEPGHVEDVIRFAQRAWRRPLTAEEPQKLRDFYASLRGEHRLDHEAALRALVARVLVSPAFLYRAEPAAVVEPPTSAPATTQAEIVPLSDWELASRLSYFLWSSLPDDELCRVAAAGKLREPAELERQTKRMLRDPKARRLAAEFFGQWLGFYRFDEFRGIDSGRFPEFSDALRQSMHDEAIALFEHIVREDRPVSEIVLADYTFLNAPLARHYGIDSTGLPENRHVKVQDVDESHRGGLLGLAAIHSVTSAPLRTSAVKRGDWILRRLLGTPVPTPPADVGSIAADDVDDDGLTVRKRLEAHRTAAACVNCHSRIDPLGFAMEGFDPIGRWRDAYRDGQPIDASGTLAGGAKIDGVDGLRAYLRTQEPQFQRNLSTRLLGYALGRTELASDRPLVESMLEGLGEDGRFSNLALKIVTSRQFGYRRK
jgi:mono/diheme cytochrome c family protein